MGLTALLPLRRKWWKNYFCQSLNVHWPGGVRQTEMHTAKPFVPEPGPSEFDIATGKMQRYKSPGADQIPTEMIQTGRETLHSELHKLCSATKKNCLASRKSELLYLLIKRVIKLTVVTIEAHHCCQCHTKAYQTFFSLG
jgi:hypothetical protein